MLDLFHKKTEVKLYQERRIAVNFCAVEEWFHYSPFQLILIFTAIDVAQSANAYHGLDRYFTPYVQSNVHDKSIKICIDLHYK